MPHKKKPKGRNEDEIRLLNSIAERSKLTKEAAYGIGLVINERASEKLLKGSS